MGTVRLFCFFILSLAISAHAAPEYFTFEGYGEKTTGSDAGPLENTQTVTFEVLGQIGTSGPLCALYAESQPVKFENGQFAARIGIGTPIFAAPGGWASMYSSKNSAIAGYVPNGTTTTACTFDATDASARRLIRASLGSEVLGSIVISSSPMAVVAATAEKADSADKIGAVPASRVMSVDSGTATPLTAANFSELLLLVNGTSSAYVKSSAIPSCTTGQVLKASGGAFSCVTDATGTDTLAGITCTDGKILKRVAGAWACADESGVATESDPSVQAYAKVTPGTGLVVGTGDHLAADFGTGAGKVVQGNDVRLSDSRLPTGAAGSDLTGTYPNPTVASIRGKSVAATTPLNGQLFQWVGGGTDQWQPKYISFADLKKSDGTSQMPSTCAANETLSWSVITDTFTCGAIGSLNASTITAGTLGAAYLPADTVTLACADGKIPKRVSGAWACADESGVGSENDPTVQAYAKNAPATGLIVNGSNQIAPDFGTGAGKIVQGNDSRLSDTRVASDINGVVSTGILQRTGAGTFSTLGVAAPITNSANNIGLAVGAGLTLNSGSLVPDFGSLSGKVAQGNDARFPSGTCGTGNKMRWDGTAWQCETDSATDSTKVLKSGDTMTGALGAPALNLINGAGSVTFNAPVSASGTYTWPAATPGISGYILASQTNGTLSWVAPPATGATSLAGDVTGTASSGSISASVVKIQGRNVANVDPIDGQVLSWDSTSPGAWTPVTATNSNTSNALVKRDGSGGFSAGTIAATSLSLPLATSTTGVIYKGGNRFLHDYKGGAANGENTFLGKNAGNFTSSGSTSSEDSNNTGVGASSLQSLTSGSSNSALGTSSLQSLTSGYSNTATGSQSLQSLTSGFNNAAFGALALRANSTGSYNTATGTFALNQATTATQNTANGYNAMGGAVPGNNNTAVGAFSFYSTTGQGNVGVGYNAGNAATTGNFNTVIGTGAGTTITTGSNNIAIGNGAQVALAAGNGQISIGNVIYGDSSGNIGIGTSVPNSKLDVAGDVRASSFVITSCPGGFSLVKGAGSTDTAANFCYSGVYSPNTWGSAVLSCASNGARLCTTQDYIMACVRLGSGAVATNHWTDGLYNSSSPYTVTTSSCGSTNNFIFNYDSYGNNNSYRCCIH